MESRDSPSGKIRIGKHVLVGMVAGASLLLTYSVVLVLLQGFGHALEQTGKLWYWLLALATGFGIQIGLFSFLRQGIRERQKSATAGIATSGSISAGSMVACCAHHLTEILPLIGLSSLTAFLASYQVFFMVIGILANIIGITIMLETIQRLELCPKVARWRWNMRLAKKVAMASAIVIAPVTYWVIK